MAKRKTVKKYLKGRIPSRTTEACRGYIEAKRPSDDYEKLEEIWSEKTGIYSVIYSVGKKEWLVGMGREGEVFHKEFYSGKEEAFSIYMKSKKVLKEIETSTLNQYITPAKRLIKKVATTEGKLRFDDYSNLNNLLFLATVGYYNQRGFEIGKGKAERYGKYKTKQKGTYESHWGTIEAFARSGLDIVIPNDEDVNFENILSNFKKAIDQFLENGKKLHGKENYKDKTINDYLSMILAYADEGAGLLGAKYRTIEFFVRKLKESCTGVVATFDLERAGNYKPLSVEEIHITAKFLVKRDQNAFFTFLLGLSTGLRPSELYRLTKKKLYYTLEDGKIFNYKGGELVTKTSGKVDPATLSNPSTTILTRVLLKHYPLLEGADKFLKLFNEAQKAHFDNEGHYPRRLRATLGHGLIKCEDSIKHGHYSNYNEIKERMGHKDASMAMKTYAKNKPSPGISAEMYFGLPGLELDGVVVSDNMPLYDSFVASLFLEHIPSEKAKKEFKKRYLEEWKQKEKDSSASSMKMKSF